MQKPREIALRVLRQASGRKPFVEDLLGPDLERSGLGRQDRALTQELVFGVVRWQAVLDWLIDRRTRHPVRPSGLQVLLRLGLYQLFWLDRVPDHAAVNETVALARRTGFSSQAGFINAVLRGYSRDREETLASLEGLKRSNPASGWSHPAWLVDRWTARHGLEETVRLLEWNNTPAPLFARVNSLRTTASGLSEIWSAEGVQARLGRWDWVPADSMFGVNHPGSPAALRSFREGLFYLQDPSTLLAVDQLDPRPGETILDLGAAPGGKTTLIAQFMRDNGRIVAADSSAERLERLKANCERLGITCVEPTVYAAADTSAIGEFDRVLVDVPCSNTGVLRRRVDLRWRLHADALERLRPVQADLLRAAARSVRPGGTVVYSTCSLEPEENLDLVLGFLQEHPEFQLESQRQLLPFRDAVDGVFVARLRRDEIRSEA